MKKVVFILFLAVILAPVMVLAQAKKTVQEFVMPDGKTMTFESTEGKTVTKEEAIKLYEAQKELEVKLHQQKVIQYGNDPKGNAQDKNDRKYTKNEIEHLEREVDRSESERRMSRASSNPATARQVDMERKRLESYKNSDSEFFRREADKKLKALNKDPEMYLYKKSQAPANVICVNCR